MRKTTPITVIIADDHQVYRDGLRALLSKDQAIKVVAEANTGKRLVELVAEFGPQVVITDLRMPQMTGIEAIREIVAGFPAVKIIVLTIFDNENLIIDALEAGAVGYIIKNAQQGEIIHAVKTVFAGQPYYCLSTTPQFAKKILDSRFNPYGEPPIVTFSDIERQIISLICNEATNSKIAKEMNINQRTVETIRSQIFEKINVKTSAGLVIYAVKNGLFRIN